MRSRGLAPGVMLMSNRFMLGTARVSGCTRSRSSGTSRTCCVDEVLSNLLHHRLGACLHLEVGLRCHPCQCLDARWAA